MSRTVPAGLSSSAAGPPPVPALLPPTPPAPAAPKALTREQFTAVLHALEAGKSARQHIDQTYQDLRGTKIYDLLGNEANRIQYIKSEAVGQKFKRALDVIRFSGAKLRKAEIKDVFGQFGPLNLFQKAEIVRAKAVREEIAEVRSIVRKKPYSTWELMRGCPTDETWLRAKANKVFPKEAAKLEKLSYAQYDFVKSIIAADEFDVHKIIPSHVLEACTKEENSDIRRLFTEEQREHFRRWLGQSGKAELVTHCGELMYRYKNHDFTRWINESYSYEPIEKLSPDERQFGLARQIFGFDPRDINGVAQKECLVKGSLAEGRELFLAAKERFTHNEKEYIIDEEHGRVIYKDTSIKQIVFTDDRNVPIRDNNALDLMFKGIINYPLFESAQGKENGPTLTFQPLQTMPSTVGRNAKQIYQDCLNLNFVGKIVTLDKGPRQPTVDYRYYIVGNRIIFAKNREANPVVRQLVFLDNVPLNEKEALLKNFLETGGFDRFESVVFERNGDEYQANVYTSQMARKEPNQVFTKLGFDPRDEASVRQHFANAVKRNDFLQKIDETHACLFAEGGRVIFAPINKLKDIKKGDLRSIKMFTIAKFDGTYPKEIEEVTQHITVLIRASKNAAFQKEVGNRDVFTLNLNSGKCECSGIGKDDVMIPNIHEPKYLKQNKVQIKKSKRKT